MSDTPIDIPSEARSRLSRWSGWIFPLARIAFVVATGFLAWYVAGHWDRWTAAARYQSTDDAYMAGDVTPLAAKVSGYVASVPVGDYRQVHAGDLVVEIDAADYRAQLAQAEATLARRRLPSRTSPTRRMCSAR